NFIIYHSGFETGHRESPFDTVRATHGVDTLIKSLLDNGIAPNRNVYAELGSTWRFVMRDPTMAAHLFGKLLVHVGQDNVLWGTDSVWYGSPQDQIQLEANGAARRRLWSNGHHTDNAAGTPAS